MCVWEAQDVPRIQAGGDEAVELTQPPGQQGAEWSHLSQNLQRLLSLDAGEQQKALIGLQGHSTFLEESMTNRRRLNDGNLMSCIHLAD